MINSLVCEVLQLPGVKIVAEIHIWPHRARNAYFREGINYELAPLDAFARPGLSLVFSWQINTLLPSGEPVESQQVELQGV